MKHILLVLTALILCSQSTRANGNWWDKGNGGFVLKCDRALKTFDLHELESRYSGRMSLDPKNSDSLEDRVDYLISKVDRLNPTRAAIYREWFKSFFAEARFTQDPIHPLPDIGFGEVPEGCELVIAVYQRNPNIITPERYTVFEPLWNRLSVSDKAALILHELIYREAVQVENQHLTSERSRYLNAWIHSQEFLSVSLKKYLLDLQELHFQGADFGPHKVSLGFYDLQTQMWVRSLLEYKFNSDQPSLVTIRGFDAIASTFISPLFKDCLETNNGYHLAQLSFHESGTLKALRMNSQEEICAITLKNRGFDLSEKLPRYGNIIGFEGRVQGTTFTFTKSSSQLQTHVAGIYKRGHIFFFDNYRFELDSNQLLIEHFLEDSQVQKIVLRNVRLCNTWGTRQIRVSVGDTPFHDVEIKSGQVDSLLKTVNECRPPGEI